MSHYSPLGEAATAAVGVENMEEITVSVEGASNDDRYVAIPNAEDDLDEGASENVKLRTCYFGSSTITIGKIKEVEEKGYFPEGEAHTPGAETMP
jgi:hypothetical protein